MIKLTQNNTTDKRHKVKAMKSSRKSSLWAFNTNINPPQRFPPSLFNNRKEGERKLHLHPSFKAQYHCESALRSSAHGAHPFHATLLSPSPTHSLTSHPSFNYTASYDPFECSFLSCSIVQRSGDSSTELRNGTRSAYSSTCQGILFSFHV
jgi:hypothetical protein